MIEIYSSELGLSPHEEPELYSGILLGDMFSPGFVELSGHDRNKNWDNQEAKGSTGASSVLNGDPIGSFQATFYLADDFDRDEWELFQRLILSTVAGPTPTALPVYHPDLARNGFTEVVLASLGGMTHDERGGSVVVVKFQEHKPPAPKPPARAQARTNSGATTADAEEQDDTPAPIVAAREELDALVNQANEP